VTISTWLFFCATETVLCFTPGPAVLLVISLALVRGTGAGLRASVGILAANVFYFGLSATSLGAILVTSWRLFFVIKWLGAAYLAWLGARMILLAGKESPSPPSGLPSAPRIRPFGYGVLTQAANPKALIFFTALLPQFIDPASAIAKQVLVLGTSSVVIEFAVLGFYVIAAERTRRWTGDARFAVPLERGGGLFLLAAGARLAAIRQS